jgi:hypothetical protein
MTTEIQKDQPQPVEIVAPLHFLITCSETSLEDFELAKLADVNNLRSQLHRVLDDLDGRQQSGGVGSPLPCPRP